MGLTVITENKQNGWNPCAIENGKCSHLCFYKQNNYTCECPDSPTEESCKLGKILETVISLIL